MKDRPIPFSGAMVRAVLSDTKTQTRRHVKQLCMRAGMPEPEMASLLRCCPYGAPGDRLWVREAWRTVANEDALPPRDLTPAHRIWYEADSGMSAIRGLSRQGKLRPGMFMPRWASRITLEVTGVRVERLHDISEADARAEGIVPFRDGHGWHTEEGRHYAGSAIDAYLNLWADINGEESAKANPFVWCIEFRKTASGSSNNARSNEQDERAAQEGTT